MVTRVDVGPVDFLHGNSFDAAIQAIPPRPSRGSYAVLPFPGQHHQQAHVAQEDRVGEAENPLVPRACILGATQDDEGSHDPESPDGERIDEHQLASV